MAGETEWRGGRRARRDADSGSIGLKWALAGLLIGLALGGGGTLLLRHLFRSESVPQRLSDAMHCPSPNHSNAATALRPAGYSRWAALNAETIEGVGCNTGPAATYLGFDTEIGLHHALHSLRGYGSLCIVDNGFFEGHSLNGHREFRQLCDAVGGTIRRL